MANASTAAAGIEMLKQQFPNGYTDPKTQKQVIAPSSSSSSKTSSSSANNSADALKKQAAADAQAKKDQEAKAKAAYEDQMRSGIRAAYAPVYGELDRQLGQIPGLQSQYNAQISDLATQQMAGIRDSLSQSNAKLDASRAAEMDTAKQSLRNLENDIRNNLKAYSFYFGSRGAGDSSATGVASDAIATGGLKARANTLGVRDKALGDIEVKRAEIQSIADSENRKVDEWKSNKIFETVQFFQNKLDDLNKAKASAKGEEQTAINNLIANTHADFLNRARQIDDDVTQFRNGIDTWKLQRAAALEDFVTQQRTSSQYSTTTPAKLQVIENQYHQKYAINPYTGEVVQDYSGLVSEDAKAENKGLGSYLYDYASGAAQSVGNAVSNLFSGDQQL